MAAVGQRIACRWLMLTRARPPQRGRRSLSGRQWVWQQASEYMSCICESGAGMTTSVHATLTMVVSRHTFRTPVVRSLSMYSTTSFNYRTP